MSLRVALVALLFLATGNAMAQVHSGDSETPEADSKLPLPDAALPLAPIASPNDVVGSKSGDISLEDWNRDDWMLIKPKVSLVDLNGYMRLRADLFRRMDFDNGSVWETGYSRYVPTDDGHADYLGTNMRLRLEPRINITEQVQVVITADLLDNIILGSTPDALIYGMRTTPVNILSRSQNPPRRFENALTDSIVIKRAYGRITALNEQLEVRFGRMPDHWGLGLWANSGDCLDCDYGTVVDRIAVSFRALNHVFMPMVDWVSKGPMHRAFGANDPQPMDAVPWDDTMQYAVRIMREDHPEDIRDAVAHGRDVFNYGMSNALRLQARDINGSFYNNPANVVNPGFDPNRELPAGIDERRDAVMYYGDLYAKYFAGNFELGVEAAVEAGTFKDTLLTPMNPVTAVTSVFKIGGALEAKYHLRGDMRGVQLSLKGGAASGDSRDGAGALDQADTQRGPTTYGTDSSLRNFQFSPDYHIDMILFRRLLGTVTDAWYVRPEVAYGFDEKVSGRLAAIYSQALNEESTASAITGLPGSNPLGVEFNGELTYGIDTNLERGQFLASLGGGILFPLGGFNNPTRPPDQQAGSFAWTLQGRLYLTF